MAIRRVGYELKWTKNRKLIVWATEIAAVALAISTALAPSVRADGCDSTFSVVPADGSFTYAITPICDPSNPSPVASPDVVIAGPGGSVVSTNGGAAVVTGLGAVGYTTPGNTPYVNGMPDRSPYSNITLFTPAQAAAARASGNASATANAYSQYGGFSPPGNTATRNHPPAVYVPPR